MVVALRSLSSSLRTQVLSSEGDTASRLWRGVPRSPRCEVLAAVHVGVFGSEKRELCGTQECL